MSPVVIDCIHICGLHINFCLISSVTCRNDLFSGVTVFDIYSFNTTEQHYENRTEYSNVILDL
jgi:hypothetical protein